MAMGAADANTLVTSGPGLASGEREDLANIIARIDPDQTPLFSNMRKGQAKAIVFDWLVQDLSAAVDTNIQPEGFETTVEATTPTVRFENCHQISARSAAVSASMDAVDKAGRDTQLAYEKILKGLELRRDINKSLWDDRAIKKTDARVAATPSSWITNGSVAATGGAFATGDGTDTVTQGTPEALTLAKFDTCMKEAYIDGGQPRIAYMSPTNKTVFSDLDVGTWSSTIANQYNMSGTNEGVYIGSVSTYLTDFGIIDVVVDRFAPDTTILVLDPNYIECCTLPGRNFQTVPLAKTGDNEKFHVVCEWSLKVRAPEAHAGIFGLSGA